MATARMYRDVADSIERMVAHAERQADKEVIAHVTRELADCLKRDNRAFRYDKFFEACGLNEFGFPK